MSSSEPTEESPVLDVPREASSRSRNGPHASIRFIAGVLTAVAALLAISLLPSESPLYNDVYELLVNPNFIGVVAIVSVYAIILFPMFFSRRYRSFVFSRMYLFFSTFARALELTVGIDPTLPDRTKSRSSRFQMDRYQRGLLRQQRRFLAEIKDKISPNSGRLSASTEEKIVGLFKEALDKSLPGNWRSAFLEAMKSTDGQGRQESSMAVMERAVQRLQAASSTVTIRGFVNLVIGIGFAFGALYVLRESVAIFSPEQLSRMTMGEAVYLVGVRISLALVITLISYFFLSLYRRSLEDAKYYQNEVTQLETHMAGLNVALSLSAPEIAAAAVQTLMKSGQQPPASGSSDLAGRERLLLALIEKLPAVKGERS